MRLDDIKDERVRKRIADALGNQAAVSSSNVESNPGNASLAAKKTPRFVGPVRIHVRSRLRFQRDCDGTSAKYIVDAIVSAGILATDTPEDVESVTHSQERTKIVEETIITIQGVERSAGQLRFGL